MQRMEFFVSYGATLFHPEEWNVGKAPRAVREGLRGRDAALLTGEQNGMQRRALHALSYLFNINI